MKRIGNAIWKGMQTVRNAVDANKVLLDKIVAALLALCPLLQHYCGPIYNAALTVAVLLVPYLLLRMLPELRDFRLERLRVVLVMVLYLVYRVIDHGTSITELGQSGVLIIYLLAVALGCIDVRFLCKVATLVALAASMLLALQYICFYIFGFHVQLVITQLLLPSAEQWILGAQTGLAGITGRISDFYRPSAFFLEPSHFYIYAFPHLFILLFGNKDKRMLWCAMLISLGMVLSTSGMGIYVTAGAWVLYLALYDGKSKTFSLRNIVKMRNLIMIGVLLALFAAAVAFVPPIRRAVARIFTTETGVTAIAGRVSRALRGLKDLTPLQWIIGVEDTTHGISYNMPGLVAALYRHGLIGMIGSVELYTKSIFKLKLPFALTAVVILITSMFSAHTHSTIGILYYTLILVYGYQVAHRKPERNPL